MFNKWIKTNVGDDASGWKRYINDHRNDFGELHQTIFLKPDGKWKIMNSTQGTDVFCPYLFDTAEEAKEVCERHTLDDGMDYPAFDVKDYSDYKDDMFIRNGEDY